MSYAMNVLQDQLRSAQAEYAEVAADKKKTIEEGRRAQRTVDAAAEKVANLQRAINTLNAAGHADQVTVDDE